MRYVPVLNRRMNQENLRDNETVAVLSPSVSIYIESDSQSAYPVLVTLTAKDGAVGRTPVTATPDYI